MTTYQPMKKPKGKELTAEQKQRNKEISKKRVGVEHRLGDVKVFALVYTAYRNFRIAGCIIGGRTSA